jgi:hypothetical protein
MTEWFRYYFDFEQNVLHIDPIDPRHLYFDVSTDTIVMEKELPAPSPTSEGSAE